MKYSKKTKEKEIEYENISFQNNFQNNFIAKKSLGQNFLHAPNIISAMVNAGKVSKESTVLEVGPGKGALTLKLLETDAKVIAIEKDDRAILFLKEKFEKEIKNGQLKLIHGDILEFDINSSNLFNSNNSYNAIINSLKSGNYIIIANIPYYITGEFIRKFLETDNQPLRMVIMLQKEVAKRIVDKKESILSISVKAYGEPKYLCTIPRKLFRPMPNVDSAVLVIENISKRFFADLNLQLNNKKDEKNLENNMENLKNTEKLFFEMVKAGFAHKRKVLIRNLEEKIPKERLEKIWEIEKIDKKARAEDLSPEMWKRIIGNI